MPTLELESPERDLLLEMLEAAEKEKLHELHHTKSLDFKRVLRTRLTLIERITGKLTQESRPV